MDKLIVAHIDAQMGNAAGVGACKEHQITGLQFGFGNGCTHGPLLGTGPRQGNAMELKYILHKAGAVKTAGGGATPEIGYTDVLLGSAYDLMTGGCGGRCGTVQRGSAGSHSGRLTPYKKQRRFGRILILIRNFRQIQIIAADVTDGVAVDHLEPLVVDTDNVGLVSKACLRHNTVRCGRTASDIYTAAIDTAVAKLCVFPGGVFQIIAVHISGLQVVVDLIPQSGFSKNDSHIIFRCIATPIFSIPLVM